MSAVLSPATLQSFHVTVFRDNRGKVINAARDMDQRELERVIVSARPVRNKDAQPLLKLARFGDMPTGAGSLRHDANVTAVSGVEGDYDGSQVPMPMQHAADILSSFGVSALLYTTASNTLDDPHWRVIAPLSVTLEGSESELREQRAHWVGVLNALFGGVLKGESFALSQCFYFGPIENAPAPEIIRVSGVCIDQLEDLPEPIIASTVRTETTRKQRDDKALSDLTGIIDGAHIYNTTLGYTARLVAKGVPADEVHVLVSGFLRCHREAWNNDEKQQARFDEVMQKLPRMIEGAEKFGPAESVPERIPEQTDRRSIALKDIEPVLIVDSEIKRVLGARGIAAVIAESGAGKSYAVQYMGAHASKGLRWHGRRTRAGLWWFCLREGFDAAQNRFAGMKREHPELADAPLELDPDGVSLNDPLSCLAFVERVRKREKELGIRIAVIVIDTLAWAMPGGSENDPKDLGLALSGARSLRDALNATVLLIHHLGKDATKGARGHSSLKAALDTELTIEKRGDVRVISASKQRDYESGQEIASFKLRQIVLGKDQDGEDVTTCVVDTVDLTDVPVPLKKPTGGNQKALLAELELRASTELKSGKLPVWTEGELREICAKDLRMKRQSDRDAVLGLRQLGYLVPTIGGSRLAHLPFSQKMQKTSETADSDEVQA